jgi:hypothetical protein
MKYQYTHGLAESGGETKSFWTSLAVLAVPARVHNADSITNPINCRFLMDGYLIIARSLSPGSLLKSETPSCFAESGQAVHTAAYRDPSF